MSKHYMFYGRLNPMTRAHEAVIDQMITDAKRDRASATVAFSHTSDRVKNPLSLARKEYYLDQCYQYDLGWTSTNQTEATLLHLVSVTAAFSALGEDTTFRLYCGSDRLDEYESLLNRYNRAPGPHGAFYFENIEVWCVGSNRTPFVDQDVSSINNMRHISSSAMRASVIDGRKDDFYSMCPVKMPTPIRNELWDELKGILNV